MVAKAGFSILRGNSPRIWPRPGSLLRLEKSENAGEFGGEVAPWRRLEQVARGSFYMKKHGLRAAGMRQGQIRGQHRASWKPQLGSTLVEMRKASVKEAVFPLA